MFLVPKSLAYHNFGRNSCQKYPARPGREFLARMESEEFPTLARWRPNNAWFVGPRPVNVGLLVTGVFLFLGPFGTVDGQQTSCRSPDGQTGECIPLTSCRALKYLIDKTLNRDDYLYLQKATCGFAGSVEPKVCCVESQASGNKIDDPRVDEPGTETETTTEEPDQVPDVSRHPNLHLLDLDGCGKVSSDRIIGGNLTRFDEYPWMALLAYRDRRGKIDFRCGGSIINDLHILTAAHCIKELPAGLNLVSVRVGDHNVDTERDCEYGEYGEVIECAEKYQNIEVVETIAHEGFAKTKLHDDIALVRLAHKMDMKPPTVRPICLPIGEMQPMQTDKLVVTGWGATESGMSSPVLLKLTLQRYDQECCRRVFARQTQIWQKQLCMGGDLGQDSCQGDSGGPLQGPSTYNGDPRLVQYGIVSFGVKPCGRPDYPGVYTRVDYYVDWILDHLVESSRNNNNGRPNRDTDNPNSLLPTRDKVPKRPKNPYQNPNNPFLWGNNRNHYKKFSPYYHHHHHHHHHENR